MIQSKIDAVIDSAPAALNTLNELAAALGDDANFSTTITNSLATKAPLQISGFNRNTYSSYCLLQAQIQLKLPQRHLLQLL